MSNDGYELARSLRALLPRRMGGGRYAEPPFFGYLEEPDGAWLPQVQVRGWLFNRGSDVVGLSARFQGGAEVPLQSHLLRLDLEAAFPGEPRATRSGFRGTLERSGARLEIWAELSTGQRRLAFATVARQPLLAPVVAEVRKRLLLNRLRPRFEEVLARAAGDQFPRVAPAEVWDALCRGWSASGRSWSELQRALNQTPPAPPPPRPGATKRRILVVSGMFPSVAHGGGLRLFDILMHLSAKNEIDLYSAYREELDAASLPLLLPRLSSARLVRSDQLQAGDVEAWLGRTGRSPGDYDAVHFEYPQAAPLVAPLRHWGRRSFFTMIECLTLAGLIDIDRARSGAELANAAVSFVRRYGVERAALGAAHHGIAVTDADADFAERCFGARPLVVPTCVSDHEIRRHLRPSPPPAEKTALFVGYYDHYPNRDALQWYLENVHARVTVPGYRLRIVGHGDLSALRARFGADPRIQWVGSVEALVPELQAARIGLAPLVSGAGIRGKINQHAVCGRPSVSTSIGGLGLPYRHGESILYADAPVAFAQAVTRLLDDDALWQRLSQRCLEVADANYLWPPALAPLESLHGA